MMKKRTVFIALLLLLLIGCTQAKENILVEDRIQLGQSRESALQAFEELEFSETPPSAEARPNEMLFVSPSDKTKFLGIVFGDKNEVRSLRGRVNKLKVDGVQLSSNSTMDEVEAALPNPTWKKHVGNGTIGLCYESRLLYLTFVNNKLSGFSLGAVPSSR
jgi:hypothetical protein